MVKATVEKSEKSRVVLSIEVPAEDFEKAIQQAYRKMAPSIQIPGFRKGRAPRKLIEARFGKEVFFEEAIDIIVPKAYSEAVEKTGIEPIDRPDIDIVSIASGQPLVFKAEVDVMPEVNLGEYKGLEVTKHIYKVDEHEVDEQLEQLRERFAELVTVEERDEVKEGDFVNIDFTGYVDGEPFPGGAGQGYDLEIGSGQFVPGFEEQLVGTKVGSEVEVNVTFPEDYREKSLAGKNAIFKVKINAIKEKRLPELDDEFAKDVGEDVETLEELEQNIFERLQQEANNRSESELRGEVLEKAAANAQVDIPQVLIEREAESLLNEFRQMLAYQGMLLEQYLEATGQTREELLSQFRPRAEQRVKNALVLEAIAKAEGITVSQEEVDVKIEEYVKDSPDPDKARERWQSFRDNIEHSLLTGKTIDFLVENAKVTEVEVEHNHGHDVEEGSEVEEEVKETQ